jgi:uncharacterized membrane protein HdeD (DUF308 family)
MSDQRIGEAPVPNASVPTPAAAPTGDTSLGGGVTGRATGVLMEKAPWRRGVGWPVIGAEGLLALAAGVYLVADPSGAKDVVRQLMAAVLLLDSVLRVLQGVRDNPQGLPATPYRLVSGGIGVAVGVVVLAEWFTDYITVDAARWVLAFGFLAFGLIGLAAAFATRRAGGLRIGPVITGAASAAFAVLLYYNLRHNSLNLRWFGWVFLGLGAVMLGFAYLLYSREKAGDAAGAEAAV